LHGNCLVFLIAGRQSAVEHDWNDQKFAFHGGLIRCFWKVGHYNKQRLFEDTKH
jgi:hypothetical protein